MYLKPAHAGMSSDSATRECTHHRLQPENYLHDACWRIVRPDPLPVRRWQGKPPLSPQYRPGQWCSRVPLWGSPAATRWLGMPLPGRLPCRVARRDCVSLLYGASHREVYRLVIHTSPSSSCSLITPALSLASAAVLKPATCTRQ